MILDFAEAQALAAVKLLAVFGTPATLISRAPRELTEQEERAGRRDEALDALPRRRTVSAAIKSAPSKGVDGRETRPTRCTTLVEPLVGDQLVQGGRTYIFNSVTALMAKGKAVAFVSEVS